MKKKKYKFNKRKIIESIPTVITMTSMIALLGCITVDAIQENTYKTEKQNKKEETKVELPKNDYCQLQENIPTINEPLMPIYNIDLNWDLREYMWEECKRYNWADGIEEGYKICTLVMFNESKFDSDAINYNADGSVDKGLFQINSSRISSLANDLCIPINEFDCFNYQHNISAGVYYINTLYNNLSVYGYTSEQKVGATYMGLARGGNRARNIILNNGINIIHSYPYSVYTNKIINTKRQLEQTNSLK